MLLTFYLFAFLIQNLHMYFVTGRLQLELIISSSSSQVEQVIARSIRSIGFENFDGFVVYCCGFRLLFWSPHWRQSIHTQQITLLFHCWIICIRNHKWGCRRQTIETTKRSRTDEKHDRIVKNIKNSNLSFWDLIQVYFWCNLQNSRRWEW